jgi:hypothetical protein
VSTATTKPETIVMYDAPDLVKVETRTLTGYWDATGRLWENAPSGEHMARYVACTHVRCDTCGAPTPKTWTKCADCRHKGDIARYEAMPRAAWDGTAMLYSEAADRYFSDTNEALDYLDDEEIPGGLAGLLLVICEPVIGRTIDSYDFFEDQLPDEADWIPEELKAAVEAFNAAVRAYGTLSWQPGKFALQLDAPAPEVTHGA